MKRHATAKARQNFEWIAKTYSIQEPLDEWCRSIVRKGNSANRPIGESRLEGVIRELEDLNAQPIDDWQLSIKRFKQGGWFARLKSITALVKHRSPPNKIRVLPYVFSGLSGSVRVEVQAVYEIDLAKDVVSFLHFASFAPE